MKMYEFENCVYGKLSNSLFSCPFGRKNISLLPDREAKLFRSFLIHILLPIHVLRKCILSKTNPIRYSFLC